MEEQNLDYQKVGEMFVMQYYTQMHKDPSQMYKFYQDSSTFVHGGSEMGKGELIMGKTAIHERILALNLHQVHTKIRQVDSHASIRNQMGPSVVIQVTGELSVARETMRPFVQTFVLVKESERNYFVFNDIFRYQLYDEDLETDQQQIQEDIQDQIERPSSKEIIQSPLIPDDVNYEQTLPTSEMELLSEDKRSPVPLTGSNPGHSDVIPENMSTRWNNDQFGNPTPPPHSNGLPEEAHMTLGEEPSYPLETVEDENTTPNETNVTEEVNLKDEDSTSLSDTKTWAARIAKNIKGSSQPYYSSTKPHPLPPTQQPAPQQPRLNNANPLPQRDPKPVKKPQLVNDRPPEKKAFNSSANAPLTTRSAPDSHQVFVGGLPMNTTENELREVFAQFGNVVEVRVNPKNFGFVVFDNDKSVRDVMASKDASPLQLRDKRLNIEEKRQSNPKGIFTGGSGGSYGNRKGPLRPVNRPPRRN